MTTMNWKYLISAFTKKVWIASKFRIKHRLKNQLFGNLFRFNVTGRWQKFPRILRITILWFLPPMKFGSSWYKNGTKVFNGTTARLMSCSIKQRYDLWLTTIMILPGWMFCWLYLNYRFYSPRWNHICL